MTWKANLARIPGKIEELRQNRLVEAGLALERAARYEAGQDIDGARQAYSAAEEFSKQYHTLTDNGAAAMVANAHAQFLDFAVNRDPVFKQCVLEVLAIVEEQPCILQTDLYPRLSMGRELAGYAMRFASEVRVIRREKAGRSYQVWKA